MNGIAHILTPMSAAWCGWTLFGLLICLVLAEVAQPGIVTQVPTVLFAKTERTYKSSPDTLFGQLFITLFRLGVLALMIQLCFYTGGEFRFASFALLMGIILAVVLVKMLCNVLIDYTFQLSRHYASPYDQYNAIATMAALILYPGLLVILRLGNVIAARWFFGFGTLVFLSLIVFRCWRTYVHSLDTMGYVLLYILTLEVIPSAALLWISSWVLAN